MYHGSAEGTGVAPTVSSVNLAAPAWTSPVLDGQLYGEPLVSDGRVIVATENDTVYALSSATGSVEWSTHLGTPVPSGSLPCGDISPTVGITGTPVIDEARSEVFVVADELVNGSPAHELVGLSTATGKSELSQDVDPPAPPLPPSSNGRASRSTPAGSCSATGGFGDCSWYHGWVVSVPKRRHPRRLRRRLGLRREPGRHLDGRRRPGGGRGRQHLGRGGQRLGVLVEPRLRRQRLVLELSPSLTLLQYFAPSSWADNNAHDLDM